MKGVGIYDEEFVQLKEDIELIKENIKRILLTLPGERVGNPGFGSRVREYLFDFADILLEDLEQVIITAITSWEPRVNIMDINISLDEEINNKINVEIFLQLKDKLDEFNLGLQIIF